ncbi:hypothetical protein DFH27DRAFT_525748 [Peziza echinospora]|nr:hypothetical protein DFH27DRAFT_525748 [Peziza echinospora]
MTVASGIRPEPSSARRNNPNHSNTPATALPLANPDSYISASPSLHTSSSTSLAELAHLVKLQTYQEHKHTQSRIRLHKCLVSNALSVRLTRTADTCHTVLVDHLKSDLKKDFAKLYNALHDVRNSCEATRRFALLEPNLDQNGRNNAEDIDPKKELNSWLHEIPHHAREAILSFVSMIRSNPRYLSSRLARLSSAELENMVRFHQSLSPPDSVISNPRRGPTSLNTNARGSPNVPSPIERLLSFHRGDPLYTLLHTIFANSMGPDSAEDKRRTDVWATTCARLLNESKGEQFLFAVLDSWAAMREWPAKNNLETCLMGLLQEGAFLLDRAEDQPGAKSPQELRGKIDLLAEEFHSRGVRELFKVLDDDPSAGGIPEGVLELGNAILSKIEDPKRKKNAEMMIMVKWFFGRFLISGIQYPEYHGIMSGYYISEHARLKILRPLINKMTKAAYNVMWVDMKQSAPVEPTLRIHIENLLTRFRAARPADSPPILLPSKSITAPPETLDIQPYIVLCPADVVTLYNALYPPNSSSSSFTESREIKRTGNRPVRPLMGKSVTSGGYDMGPASVLSNSSSSLTSDSASLYAPLLERSGVYDDKIQYNSAMPSPASFSMPSSASFMGSDEISASEKLGADIRSAVEAMKGRLAPEVTSGRCHPCAEKWAVLFVSTDGTQLSLKMKSDLEDDDDDEDEAGHDSDSEDDGPGDTDGFDTDYNQLKESIKKLVGEFEVPENVDPDQQKYSNRTSPLKCQPLKVEVGEEVPEEDEDECETPPVQLDPSNPYYPTSNLTAMLVASQKPTTNQTEKSRADPNPTKESGLSRMLSAAYQQCLARGDYVRAQQYHRALVQLSRLPVSLGRDGHNPLLHIFSRGARDTIEKCAGVMEEIEAWFVWLASAQERQDNSVKEAIRKIQDLRDKMWYVTDVRNSAAYEEAKSVTLALKKMGQPVKPSTGKPAAPKTRSGLGHRMSTSNISLLKSDTIMDILAAPIEHGGPNKLSDEQADITANYLSRFSVENFCKGEERIHRFCCEIDKCVTKLVGDGILDGPVLWSSELYSRDDRDLATIHRKAELYLPMIGDYSQETDDGRGIKKSFDMLRRPSATDLLSLSRSRLSSSGTDMSTSRSVGRTRSNAGMDSMMDQQDLFGAPSPTPQPSTPTFWSPFASLASNRAKAPQPTPALMIKPPEEVNEKKRKFLSQLKQSLTGLLISDLGVEVFGQGSETDVWFSGDIGLECIQRKEEQEAETRKKAAEKAMGAKAKRASKKKSMKSLRRAATHNNGIFEALGKGEKGELAAPIATFENAAHDTCSGEENSSSSDAPPRNIQSTLSKKGGLTAFPYQHAFKSLLNKFSTHPNPYQKLQALYELELLIVASLSSTTPKFFGRNMSNSPVLGVLNEATSRISSLQLSQPTNLEGVIANVEERRSHATNNTTVISPMMTPTGSRSPRPVAPSTDMIVEVLQNLFRQADIRPRTLFRDLQYVAAFVPASILDMTEIGKAFWDTGLAALGLKQDVCRTMVEIADEIIAYHTKKRVSDAKAKNSDHANSDPLARHSMKDAARMWTITAKEGDPTAQRELAIFYLTNPSLLPRCTKPLSKPKDTFRPDMMVARGEDPEKRDPATMCVSYHWMELSSQGGDELAKKYLLQRDEGW